MDTKKIMKVEKNIIKIMEEKKIYGGEVYCDKSLPVVFVEIEGDWKHEHLFLDNLLKKHGYVPMNNEVLSSDGGDWYTAKHAFIVPNESLV